MAFARRTMLQAMVLAAVMILFGGRFALAAFTSTAHGGPATIAAGTLSAPGSVKAAQTNCKTNKSPEIAVEWSASSSSWVTGYTVERATASAGPYTSVTSLTSTQRSYTDSSGSLGYSSTYYYRVGATYHSWATTSSSVSVKTLSKSCA